MGWLTSIKLIWSSYKGTILTAMLIAAVSTCLVFVNKLYKAIEENGAAKLQIEVLKNSNADLEEENKKLGELRKIDQRIILSHQYEVKELEDKIDGMNKDLGQGANDLAPESLREYFKRLGKIK